MAIQDNFERLEAFAQGPFKGLCTPAEFAEIHEVDESAIRHAIKSGRLIPGKHCLKLGKQWVLCAEAFPAWKQMTGYSKLSEINTDYKKALRALQQKS